MQICLCSVLGVKDVQVGYLLEWPVICSPLAGNQDGVASAPIPPSIRCNLCTQNLHKNSEIIPSQIHFLLYSVLGILTNFQIKCQYIEFPN